MPILPDVNTISSGDGEPDPLARTIEAMERIHAAFDNPREPRLAAIAGDITLIRLLSAGRRLQFEREAR